MSEAFLGILAIRDDEDPDLAIPCAVSRRTAKASQVRAALEMRDTAPMPVALGAIEIHQGPEQLHF